MQATIKKIYFILSLSLCSSLIPVMADIPNQGQGWPELHSRIYNIIEEVMRDNNIPGMTVAISKDGRRIFNKGFGLARDSDKAVLMRENMRTLIGSVTKATITGPSAYKMMEEQGINPKTKKLFNGINSVFKYSYSSDILQGNARFNPIVGTAINAQNRVISWYMDGTYSIGTSMNLDLYQSPKPFKLPPGKILTDIRDIGITKYNKVYAWYNDGTRSIAPYSNKYSDLGNISVNSQGNPRKVIFPSDKSMLNVVGIAIAKSNNHIYIWYDDGTLSSGTSLNFTYYFKDKRYKLQGGSPYQIRNMAIASNDRIYTWLNNNMAQSGYSRNLSYYRPPYYYSAPYINLYNIGMNPYTWYKNITLQDILDHKAGFQRSEDKTGTKKMFNLTDNTMTYSDIVSHFLQTRPLKWQPGGSSSLYSNFGFVIWGAIFPVLTGQSFEDYATNNFLEPLGLDGLVRPSTIITDGYDSCGHQLINGKIVLKPNGDSLFGAAGGWTASAGDLLTITNHLQNTYSLSEIDDMGWGATNSGILSHNGAISGGMSYVVMFPLGYTSVVTGGDLSNVHIALAANRWSNVGALTNLANEIAREVPNSNVPTNYEVGKPLDYYSYEPIDCN